MASPGCQCLLRPHPYEEGGIGRQAEDSQRVVSLAVNSSVATSLGHCEEETTDLNAAARAFKIAGVASAQDLAMIGGSDVLQMLFLKKITDEDSTVGFAEALRLLFAVAHLVWAKH